MKDSIPEFEVDDLLEDISWRVDVEKVKALLLWVKKRQDINVSGLLRSAGASPSAYRAFARVLSGRSNIEAFVSNHSAHISKIEDIVTVLNRCMKNNK